MHFSLRMWFLLVGTFFSIFFFSPTSSIHAFLYENGTCTNEKIKETSKQVINTNGTIDEFLKSLPSDNVILAEIVCSDSSNETFTK
jgi:hypothetical protein